jgi:hypothetical protein
LTREYLSFTQLINGGASEVVFRDPGNYKL